MSAKFFQTFRRWSRNIHRELSFFFGGALLIYAVSGFMLNHKKDFNSDYDISRKEFVLEGGYASDRAAWTRDAVLELLEPLGEAGNYTKHYFPEGTLMKVFLKGGSSLTVDLGTGEAVYESVRRRPLWSGLNRLHYNPGRSWTVFSDIFVFSLVVITLSGLVMLKGPKGFWGRGGIEFLAGMAVPVAFLLLL